MGSIAFRPGQRVFLDSNALTRQRYFFTAENAENGEPLWALLSSSPVVFVPFPCFLPFSAFSAASAVKSRVVVLIYWVEDVRPYCDLLSPVFEAALRGELTVAHPEVV